MMNRMLAASCHAAGTISCPLIMAQKIIVWIRYISRLATPIRLVRDDIRGTYLENSAINTRKVGNRNRMERYL
jgi:hypothetical protein